MFLLYIYCSLFFFIFIFCCCHVFLIHNEGYFSKYFYCFSVMYLYLPNDISHTQLLFIFIILWIVFMFYFKIALVTVFKHIVKLRLWLSIEKMTVAVFNNHVWKTVQRMRFDGHNVEIAKTFKYLGITLSTRGLCSAYTSTAQLSKPSRWWHHWTS